MRRRPLSTVSDTDSNTGLGAQVTSSKVFKEHMKTFKELKADSPELEQIYKQTLAEMAKDEFIIRQVGESAAGVKTILEDDVRGITKLTELYNQFVHAEIITSDQANKMIAEARHGMRKVGQTFADSFKVNGRGV